MVKQKQQGFTLVELLVVVAIIAILALIAMLALNPVEMARRSRDSRRLSDIGTIRRAVDLALADGASLPGNSTTNYSTTTASGTALDSSSTSNLVGMNISKYLATIPQDPQFKSGVSDTILTTTGASCPSNTGSTARSAMVYTFTSDGDTYELNAILESKDNCEIPASDGGSSASLYEIGTALTY